MNLEYLKKICESKETRTVEFKASTAHLRAVFETTCAFLNGSGGTVLIGVRDDGRIVGQHISDNTRKDVAKEIKRIEPAATIEVDYVDVEENKVVIVIHVETGHHAPYVYDGRPFQRDESETNRMSQHRYEQLLVARGSLNHAWDEQPALGYDLNLLNQEDIRNTVREGINENRIAAEVLNYNIEQMLKYLKLLKNGKITNAAVVLYAKEVEPDYTQCSIRMTRYSGNNKLANFMDSKHVYGNAFTILTEANYFTMRHLPIASFFETKKFKRIDKPALPVMAVREAIINAISHRDYTKRSASISFAIFDDRLEIWNNGILPPELNISDLKKSHESYPRNKRISKIFYSRGWVEKAGIGTVRIMEDCKKLGIPTPKFKEYSSGFAVIFKFKEAIGGRKAGVKKIELTMRQNQILILLKKSTLNSAQIVKNLKNSPSIRMVQFDLKKLEEKGLIKREGETRSTRWRMLK